MRLLAGCLTTAALAVLLVVPPARAVSDEDSVTGHVEFVNALGNHIRLSISAVRHHDGSVSGEAEEHAVTPAGDFIRRGHATVVRFTIAGNIARIGAIVDRSAGNAAPPGTEAFVTVVDNGQGANDPPDLASTPLAGPPGTAQAHCDTGIARPLFPSQAGNIQVRPSGL